MFLDYGNTVITARRMGAKVTGIDIIPKLLELAKEEEKIPELVELTRESLNFRIQRLTKNSS